MKYLLPILLILASCMTHEPEDAVRILEDAGYTNVTLTGHRFAGCSKDDNIRTGFEALGRTGRKVSGVICGQWGVFNKSNTIRID